MISAMLLLVLCRKGKKLGFGGSKGPKPNIIVLTVDTLRADHMALYGYRRDTMPAIEDFAKTAVVFDQAVQQMDAA